MLHTFRFDSILKERIWGGNRLCHNESDIRDINASPIGESWILSGVPGDYSIVGEGPKKGFTINQLIESFGQELLGESVVRRFGKELPILIKNIDAASDLSVQVHPNDYWAGKRHGCLGKNEMWYISDCQSGAKIYVGFKHKIPKQEFKQLALSGNIAEALREIHVSKGDAYFIPAGTVHAIGAGCFITEIQQSSDITYRIFDWNRIGSDGKSRQLHIDEALDVIDLNCTPIEKLSCTNTRLVSSPYFHTNKLHITKTMTRDYSLIDSFVTLIPVCGELIIDGLRVMEQQALMIPASTRQISIEGNGIVLETWV